MAKIKKEPSFYQKLLKIKHAGLSDSKMIPSTDNEWYELDSINDRISNILGILDNNKRKTSDMLFFVMYDIESNKVRRLVSKYLMKAGCFRIQRSIFLADLSPDKYEMIRKDLTEVQAFYENQDSILIVPVSTDLIKSMKIIGKNIDVDLIMRTKSTIFF